MLQATEVTDHPSDTSQTTTSITLLVGDVNDNSPVFNKRVYQGYVQEDMTDIVITIPGYISVSDADQVFQCHLLFFRIRHNYILSKVRLLFFSFKERKIVFLIHGNVCNFVIKKSRKLAPHCKPALCAREKFPPDSRKPHREYFSPQNSPLMSVMFI